LTGSRLFAEPVDLTDVAPTIREWFRGPGTEDVRPQNGGRTLLPRFDSYVSRPFESRAIVSVDARRRAAALRTAEWTLLSIATAEPSAPEIRLYDRLHDPREEQDVAALRPEKVAELRPELDRRLGAAPER
jgi:arylsulfatase A-like enzyme